MYQFSGKLKTLSLALILLGAIGIAFSFWSAPKTLEAAKEIIAQQSSHGDGHGSSHEEVKTDPHHDVKEDNHASTKESHSKVESHGENHDDDHAEHVFHQMQNKPWAAVYVALFFFLGITLLVLAFYASQRVAQSGWSVVLFRVLAAIPANLVPPSIIMIIIVVTAVMHVNHLFPWMGDGIFDPTSPNYDPIIDGKSWWMNVPGWAIRSVVYLAIWNAYRWFIRKNSIKEDTANDGGKTFKVNYNVSVGFIFLFMLTESMMSWDWIMGLEPHWFSTVFGWYVLATLLVSALTVIAFVTM